MKHHCGDKKILRPSYLHNGISYAGKIETEPTIFDHSRYSDNLAQDRCISSTKVSNVVVSRRLPHRFVSFVLTNQNTGIKNIRCPWKICMYSEKTTLLQWNKCLCNFFAVFPISRSFVCVYYQAVILIFNCVYTPNFLGLGKLSKFNSAMFCDTKDFTENRLVSFTIWPNSQSIKLQERHSHSLGPVSIICMT